MSKVRISVSLFHCTVWLVCRVLYVCGWVIEQEATRTQWHTAAGDILQERGEKEKKKPSSWKCPRGPYTFHLSISQLPGCWSKPICLQEGSKGSAALSFWKTTWPLLCLPAVRTASSWIINFCRPGQPWINDISGWLRIALPSQRNQNPSPRQRHINLSVKPFAFSLISPLCRCPPTSLPRLRLTSRLLSWKCLLIN